MVKRDGRRIEAVGKEEEAVIGDIACGGVYVSMCWEGEGEGCIRVHWCLYLSGINLSAPCSFVLYINRYIISSNRACGHSESFNSMTFP